MYVVNFKNEPFRLSAFEGLSIITTSFFCYFYLFRKTEDLFIYFINDRQKQLKNSIQNSKVN